MSRIYLDANASAPLRPAAREAMLAALDATGNASSVHAEGRGLRALVEGARRRVAAFVGADPRGVIFTAGATEAANLALAPGPRAARLIVAATEHPCVLAGHRFETAGVAPVDGRGVIDLDALRTLLSEGGPAMVALQAANNETGVLQPVRAAADLVHAAGGTLVCDAVQAAGRVPVDLAALGADALILSSHKLGGPKGAGALVLVDPDAAPPPLLRGGGQERGARAGTEDVAAIAGFGAAIAAIEADEPAASRALRETFERALRRVAPDAVIFGEGAPRLPNTTCFALPGVSAATLLMALDLRGMAVSAGSACSSGKMGRSPVLDAMGIDPHIASCAVRVSLSWRTNAAEIAGLVSALDFSLATMRRHRAA